MSAPEPPPRLPSSGSEPLSRLLSVLPAELLGAVVSAAVTSADVVVAGVGGLAPAGMPVRDGRLHLARLREWLPAGDRLVVVTGFATACWLGAAVAEPPGLGRHVHRSAARIDHRGRVVLDRRSRAWLAVADRARLEAVALPVSWDCGGLLVVPIEDYARRFEAVTP
jgi:hypothetical protein